MKKKVMVVMLPTKDKTAIIYNDSLDILVHKSHKDFSDYGVQNNKHISYQHLYITVSQDIEPIKEGDYIYHTLIKDISLSNYSSKVVSKYFRKIIATTDSKLTLETDIDHRVDVLYNNKLPQLQQSTIKQFVANPGGEYEVEYNVRKKDIQELVCPEHGIIDDEPYETNLKLNQDNTVNITSVEKGMYSKKEVITLIKKYRSDDFVYGKEHKIFKDWIKENL